MGNDTHANAFDHITDGYARSIPWPDPTPEMLATPEFEKIWQCIKRWDINVPEAYAGYCGSGTAKEPAGMVSGHENV